MKKDILIKKFFTLVGFLLLAFVAFNLNACSKDKSNNNNGLYGQYGYGPGVGGGPLGNGIGVSGDQMLTLQLSFGGQDGGSVGATGILYVAGPSVGCSLPPGAYNVSTVSPGQFYNDDFYNIEMVIQQTGMQMSLVRGWFTNQHDSFGNRRIYADVNIPGCPTAFN